MLDLVRIRKALAAGWSRRQVAIAALSVAGIACYLLLLWLRPDSTWISFPLWIVLILGGIPLTLELLAKLLRAEFGSDLLAGISIVTAVILGEHLAGALVVLMLSGGEALEMYAVRSASSVLEALARRMPTRAHRRDEQGLVDIDLSEVRIGDSLVVFPHEICPADGTVIEGHGTMDEAYLTGEPYQISKAPGAAVLSGALNGERGLTIRVDRLPVDSRYAKIMTVMRTSEQTRPRLRRLGDQLGAWYTPLAVGIALLAWGISREPVRFLAVLVVATPCPLLIAIPVAIIGAISLSARRGIVIKDPAILETLDTCRTAIFDKTGTLTYGRPELTEILPAAGYSEVELLLLAASLERYSKHPLSEPIQQAVEARGLVAPEASSLSEEPGRGLTGDVSGRRVELTSRKKLLLRQPEAAAFLPAQMPGLECVICVDGRYAGVFHFRDEPRSEGRFFIGHLGPRHHFNRVLLVSGDRESEVNYLAGRVGITDVFAGQSPEEKLQIVRAETQHARTVYVGDGINDAPAMTAATVGLAFGQNSDISAEASGAVIMDSSLEKVDELLHISRRMRRIALQSALGGMSLSLLGMMLAFAGYLPPVAGAVAQEVIDVLAVLNALRMALPERWLSDFRLADADPQ